MCSLPKFCELSFYLYRKRNWLYWNLQLLFLDLSYRSHLLDKTSVPWKGTTLQRPASLEIGIDLVFHCHFTFSLHLNLRLFVWISESAHQWWALKIIFEILHSAVCFGGENGFLLQLAFHFGSCTDRYTSRDKTRINLPDPKSLLGRSIMPLQTWNDLFVLHQYFYLKEHTMSLIS